jgi:hypothetical protein
MVDSTYNIILSRKPLGVPFYDQLSERITLGLSIFIGTVVVDASSDVVAGWSLAEPSVAAILKVIGWIP